MATLNAQDLQQKVNMRRTLLIGIGGTGQKVLVQIKARFVRNYGGVPPAVEFLCFDTDPTAEQAQMEGKVVRLVAGTELISISGIQTANIVRNLDKYPAIQNWIAEDKEKIPVAAIQMGARQVRPLGRLALFWHIEMVKSKMEGAVHRLNDLKLGADMGGDRRGMNVFIISSVCGGTGSGALLDIAYLIRRVVQDLGLAPELCLINGVLALPSVFPTVDKIGIQSNAYACLNELDYYMQTEKVEWSQEYGNPRVPPVTFSSLRPFNICYLIDGINENSQGLAGLEEIAPMIAEAIYLQIGSQVGRTNDSLFDNVDTLTGKIMYSDENRYKPTAYSSLGTASLVFPVVKIIDLCANRLGRELLETAVLREVDKPERVDAAVNSFLQANQLKDQTALLEAVTRDEKGVVLKVALDPRQLDRFKDAEMLPNTQQLLTRAESQVENQFSATLETNRKSLGEKLSAALTAEIERLVNDPVGGLKMAIAFLEKLDIALAGMRGSLDTNRDAANDRQKRSKGMETQTLTGLNTAVRSGNPLGRGGRIKEARNTHINTAQNTLVARFEVKKCETAIAILASISGNMQGRRAALQRTVERLISIKAQYTAFVERYGGGKSRVDFVLATDISTEADIQRYYTEHYKSLGQAPAASLLDKKGPLYAWLDLDQDALSDRILSYTRSVFDDLREINIENIILEKREEKDPPRRKLDLIDRSVPFWNFRTAGVLGSDFRGVSQIIVIGVPDRERSIYKDYTEVNQILTSTFDPHQITVMQTKHGIPLFALTQYNDFKTSHDYVLHNEVKPLYVIPQVRPGGEKAKLAFALGMAYGYIFKSSTYYQILPEDIGRQSIRLGQGMEASLRSFRNDPEQIAQITRQVEDQISKEGNLVAIQTLDRWQNEPYIYELKGGLPRQNIDRTTMLRDSTISRGATNYELVQQMRDAIKVYIETVLRG